ncbi:hypothetical protein CHS0354_026747 [Potamilus streckersoni]|uniref:Bicarbonate transporter-like transmembrane domain-containing protein n=1 Tax=Potamilus streckersoni TaxID=2493646 RepID=A0AAE0RMY2_9BIVA|nr:hypothetical protein CHS0354_026747 [Potamilus streckersoni]
MKKGPPPYQANIIGSPVSSINLTHSTDDSLVTESKLTVDTLDGRRRHKSEGALHLEIKSPYLDPIKRSAVYDSKSTISGIKFEDSFLDESGTTLIYSRHEKVPLKDFSLEIRATLDVKRFLNNTVLLLDLNNISLDSIINEVLHKILDSTEDKISFDQARSALFTHDYIHQLSRTLQCTSISEGGGFDYDQSWICVMASIHSMQAYHVGIARLRHPANLGPTCQEVHFVIVVLTPTKAKRTKTDLETGRTFATIFSDRDIRMQLLDAVNEAEFTKILEMHTNTMIGRMAFLEEKLPNLDLHNDRRSRCLFMSGIIGDFKRRLPHYWSDFKDGVVGPKSIQKTMSTSFFLYFACLIPSIAFGVLNSENTNGQLDVEKVLYSQTFGGLVFAILGGTPQIVLLTTAPLALYTKIIYSISEDFELDFQGMFGCVGLWNSFFLFVYSLFNLSTIMKWSTRSSEEIFAMFISIAFCIAAIKNTVNNFDDHYSIPACQEMTLNTSSFKVYMNNSDSRGNVTVRDTICQRDVSLLYLLLLLGTLWLGVTIFNFTKTPYLNAGKREMLADYALPVSVIIMSIIGAVGFRDVSMRKSFEPRRSEKIFQTVPVWDLSPGAVFGAMGLGFCLSLLFFMDQNISSALVNAPHNKMKKGTAYHWDLLIVGVINGVLSLFAFPWIHAALPHSPLHVRALADVEERVDQGHIYQIVVKVRETRLTSIISTVMIGLSLMILPYLAYIPTPVLYGLFLYLAFTALSENQLFERIMLLITEQSAYPPNHYIRRVPQRKMHLFTVLQLTQLTTLCGFGFAPYPYLKMFFPILIFLLIPLRHIAIPHIIPPKYLRALDTH